MADYEFRYSPLTGRLTGKQMIEQTEQAINQLSSLVDSAAGQVEIISTLANEANENAATALETAEEALATTGRTYITVSTQADANNYYDSQLIYIADSTSTNIPVEDTGFLEVKTNENKTVTEQVFIADSSGDAYYRHGDITTETVGDVTTYSVVWGGWSSQPASQTYVQEELTNYLPLSGGTMTGNIASSSNDMFTIRKLDITDQGVRVWGGDTFANGSSLYLYGKDQNAGMFLLHAHDGTNYKQLIGKPNGALTWGGVSLTDGTFLTTRSVSVNASSGTAGYSITAPAVSGYQFICWYMSASNGNVYPTYIADSNTSSTKVWAVNPTNNTSIVCFALYVRKW